MSVQNSIHVKIGEVKIGHEGDILKATLGSCVGIAFIWEEKKIFGLAHCLLPEAPEPTTTIGAKFVSQAVPSLFALMKIMQNDLREIKAYIIGGGNMMSQLSRDNANHVGLQNIAAAKKYLKIFGLRFTEMDTGGDAGRQVFVDCTSGIVSVTNFAKANTEASNE